MDVKGENGMKNVHRVLAVILSALLWINNPIISQAEETVSENDISVTAESSEETVSENEVNDDTDTGNGNGNTENVVSPIVSQNDVVNIEVSTVPEDMFSFILDPQGLIPATNAAKYGGAEFGEGNLFFRNEEMCYSNISNYVEIINRGSEEIEFTVTAVLNMNEDILLSDTYEFGEDDVCSIYMAIKDEDGETPICDNGGQKSIEITKTIPAATDESGAMYRFALTGACNTVDAWMEMSGYTPTVDITWKWSVIEKEELETQTYATDLVETEGIDESKVTEADETPKQEDTVSDNNIEETTGETGEETDVNETGDENGTPEITDTVSGNSTDESSGDETQNSNNEEKDQTQVSAPMSLLEETVSLETDVEI